MKKIPKLRETINISIKEGVFSYLFKTVAGSDSVFITKFAILLGATPIHFSLIAIVGTISQIFQPLGIILSNRLNYSKSSIIKTVAIGRSLAFLFGLVPILVSGEYAINTFLILLFISTSIQAVGANAWIGWISDLIPGKIRGRYFSWRIQTSMISGIVFGYLLSILIDLFDKDRGKLAGVILTKLKNPLIFLNTKLIYVFFIVFFIASLIGIWGLIILSKHPEGLRKKSELSLPGQMLIPFKDSNFRKLLMFGFWWMFALGIGAPFWHPFLLQKLQMTMIELQIYITIRLVAAVISLRFWGHLIDKFGNKHTMSMVISLCGFTPLLWLFATKSHYWFIFLEALGSGAAFAGSEIILRNFVLSIAPSESRQIYSGVFGAFTGLAMTITMLLSGVFIPEPMEILWIHLEPEQVLFGITGFARWTTSFSLMWINEPNAISYKGFLKYFFGKRFPRLFKDD